MLLRLILSQRLELNAIQSALQTTGVPNAPWLKEIRTQAGKLPEAWSSQETDDVLALIRAHSHPDASMVVAPPGSGMKP